MDCTPISFFFLFFPCLRLRWCVGATGWVHLAVLTRARTRVNAYVWCHINEFHLRECVWMCVVCARWHVHNYVIYIIYKTYTYIYIYKYSIYTYIACTCGRGRTHICNFHGGTLCACLYVLFLFSILLYIPFTISCVTVPGDLDLIFSRLSCAVRFDLHEWTRILATKCAVVAHLVAQSVVCVNKVAGRGEKKFIT